MELDRYEIIFAKMISYHQLLYYFEGFKWVSSSVFFGQDQQNDNLGKMTVTPKVCS